MSSIQASLTALIAKLRSWAEEIEDRSAGTATIKEMRAEADELATLGQQQASLTALNKARREARVYLANNGWGDKAGPVYVRRIQEALDELATLVSSPPEVPMKEKLPCPDCNGTCYRMYAREVSDGCDRCDATGNVDPEAPEPEKAHISEMVTWDTPEQLDMAGFPANIAVLREQIATLEKECRRWIANAADREEVEIQTKRAERAEAALRAYGQHTPECSLRAPKVYEAGFTGFVDEDGELQTRETRKLLSGPGDTCTCGFASALQAGTALRETPAMEQRDRAQG